MTAKYFVWAEGSWREVDAGTGRVVGWRRPARFVYARRGKLRVARTGAVLRALSAHAAGAPAAVRDGPRLSQRRYSNTCKTKKVVAAITDHVCCERVQRYNDANVASVLPPAANTKAISTHNVSTQCVPTLTLNICKTANRKKSVGSSEKFEAKSGPTACPRTNHRRPLKSATQAQVRLRSHSNSSEDSFRVIKKTDIQSPSKVKRRPLENEGKAKTSSPKASAVKGKELIYASSSESVSDEKDRPRTAKLNAGRNKKTKVNTELSHGNTKKEVVLKSKRSTNIVEERATDGTDEDSENIDNIAKFLGITQRDITKIKSKETTEVSEDNPTIKKISDSQKSSDFLIKTRKKNTSVILLSCGSDSDSESESNTKSRSDLDNNLPLKSRTRQDNQTRLNNNMKSKHKTAKKTRTKESTEESDNDRVISKFNLRKSRTDVTDENRNISIHLRSNLKENVAKHTKDLDDNKNRRLLLRSAKLNVANKSLRDESTDQSEDNRNTSNVINNNTKSPTKLSPKKRRIRENVESKRMKLGSPIKRAPIKDTSETESIDLNEAETSKGLTMTRYSDQKESQSILPRAKRAAAPMRPANAHSYEVLPKEDSLADSQEARGRSVYLELVISDEVVSLLRSFIEHTGVADLYRFDTDESYKRAIFYSINPVVDVERCPRIEEHLRRLRLNRFAADLGLRSVSEVSTQPSYKFRPRNTINDDSDTDIEENSMKKSKIETNDRHKVASKSGRSNKIMQRPKKIKSTLVVNRDKIFNETKSEMRHSSEEFVASKSKTSSKPMEKPTTPKKGVRAEFKENVPSRANDANRTGSGRDRQSRNSTHVISKRPSATGAKEYSNLEDHAIVAWVSSGARASRVNGNQLWRELQEQYHAITAQDRSWHSLRNRYLRYILPALGALQLPPAQVSRLRAAAATGAIKRKRLEVRRNSIFNKEAEVRGAATRRPRPPPSSPSPPPVARASPPRKARASSPLEAQNVDTERRDASENKTSKSRRSLRLSGVGAQPRPAGSPRYSDVTRQFAARHRAPESTSPVPHDQPPAPRTRKLYNPKAQM